jgi:hypothetical protein
MMAKFAIFAGDIVVNIINANTLEEASTLGKAIEYTDDNPAYINGKYDSETGKFLPPVIDEETKSWVELPVEEPTE